jgi:hypothetical protein
MKANSRTILAAGPSRLTSFAPQGEGKFIVSLTLRCEPLRASKGMPQARSQT